MRTKNRSKRAALQSLDLARASRPVPQPVPVGYVVRHSAEENAQALTLSAYKDGKPILLIGDDRDMTTGTLFLTWDAAFKAVEATIRYEIANGYDWTLMYGNMNIEPLFPPCDL